MKKRVPAWVTIIIVAAMLPVLAFPTLLSMSSVEALENRVFIWIYPFYVLAAGYLAWICYGRRTPMTWILITLLLLSHAAIWLLATTPL